MKCPFVIKICSRCKRILVANKINFRKSGENGLRSSCRRCENEYKNKKRRADKEKVIDKYNFIEVIKSDKVWNHCPFCIKVCTKCGEILVADLTNFRKEKRGKYELTSMCKKCERKMSKQYYIDNIDRIIEYREDNKERKREIDRRYREENKESLKQYFKQYYQENKKEKEKYRKRYYEEHKEELLEKQKQYQKENKDEIKKKRKEYCKNNPEIIFNNSCKRRQLEENQGNGVSKEQWKEMMEFFDWKCAYSGEYIGGDSKERTIDHIIPLSKGGEHEIWNCVPMTRFLNTSKKDKEMSSWYQQQACYSEERLNKIYEWVEYSYNKWGKNE